MKEAPARSSTPISATGGGSLGKLADLSRIKLQAREAAMQAAEEEAGSAERVYEIDESVYIDPELFKQHLDIYIEGLIKNGKTILATALQNPKYQLTFNKWNLVVANSLLPDLIQRETELLPYLRINLKVPNLYLEVTVDESYVNPQDARPYTDEEKLAAMAEKNPIINDLIAKFKTRIAYE
ncbi:MAG: hypothetical protein R3B47_07145 [Bacteroidia bacterium]